MILGDDELDCRSGHPPAAAELDGKERRAFETFGTQPETRTDFLI
jgi:hypothetical protein